MPTQTNSHQYRGLRLAMAALAAFIGVALAVQQYLRTSSSFRNGYRPPYGQATGYSQLADGGDFRPVLVCQFRTHKLLFTERPSPETL